MQLGLAKRSPALLEKQREFQWRLADAEDKKGDLAKTERLIQELLRMGLDAEQRLEALCFLADVQVVTFLC